MRVLVGTLAAVVAAVGCGSASSAPSGSTTPSATAATALTVSFWPSGTEKAGMKRWSLRCGPAGGTHPRAASACTRLTGMQRPFAPLPKDVACTQVYGGPQQALVTGTYRGQRIWIQLSLRDGCQIERFRKLAFLVPGFSVAPGGGTS